ncbi:MAG: ATP-binding cassette domain-containing protein [Alphaproteobacteria bacterium]|nr:ATP-binding cassette domain-containing protein [Alphaproteobacteria bacterium]
MVRTAALVSSSGQESVDEALRIAQGRAKARSLASLRILIPFLARYRWHIAGAGFALLCSSSATLTVPAALRGMIDHGFNRADADRIGHYFLLLLAVAVVLGLATGVRYYFVTWIGERVIADIRRAVFDHVLRLSPSFFEETRTGEVLSRLTADTTLIQTVIGSSASIALRNLVMLVGALVLMILSSFKLSLLVVITVPLVMVPLLGLGRWVRRLSRKSQDSVASTAARAAETLNAVQTVQAFTHEALDSNLFAIDVEASFTAAILRTRARAAMTVVVTIAAFACIVAILWVGAQDVIAGRMSGGELAQFLFYAVLVASGFGALSETWGDLQRAAGASERLAELMRTQPEIAAPAQPRRLKEPVRGALSFDAVHFSYPTRPDSAALDGLSFTVAEGEAVALVGPSGAGKSTVFQLLLRFYAPDSGVIRIDDVDISAFDPVELRRHIAVVAQDPVIFSGTIADNIRYGRPDARDDEIRRAAEAAAAAEFIEHLPRGYDTSLGERGITLSGGQRQRIAIARAMLRDAPLLLLDEATSSLDAQNERLVQHGLANLMAGRTTLVIAHRLATIQKLKRILVFDQGRLVGEGSHAELIAHGGLYARLADLQFGGARSAVG